MTASSDLYDLDRFLRAQDGVYEQALAELSAGRKRSHWMWFIFPQVAGLGSSLMSERYAIGSSAEASSYLAHPLLGARLRRCVEAMLAIKGRSAHDILGFPDDLKFHSSLTLFAAVSETGSPFQRALDRFFDGARDDKTLSRLERA
jgi:uncharacterized protein (DUF1810 family)